MSAEYLEGVLWLAHWSTKMARLAKEAKIPEDREFCLAATEELLDLASQI